MADEILGFLKSVRERGLALRRDLEASYEQHGKPPGAPWMRVVTYVGQSVKSEDEQDDENNKVP